MDKTRGLPQDTEITWCFWCREYHGSEKFCFGTSHQWLKIYQQKFIASADRWLERIAYSVALFALGCFFIALLIGLVGLFY
jgi:hypothetical protein